MRTLLISFLVAAAFPALAWGAGHGGGGGGGMGHGADVSQAAHSARMSGAPVGPSVRAVARGNSQGPSHASANAISHVQNSPGRAASNSVLGGGAAVTTTHAASRGKANGKSKTSHAR